MGDAYEFPADLPGEETGSLRWTAGVIALATLLLALLNAQSLRSWAEDFEPGPRANRVAAVARGWEDTTATFGLGVPQAKLRKGWKVVESAQWTPREAEVEEARR